MSGMKKLQRQEEFVTEEAKKWITPQGKKTDIEVHIEYTYWYTIILSVTAIWKYPAMLTIGIGEPTRSILKFSIFFQLKDSRFKRNISFFFDEPTSRDE